MRKLAMRIVGFVIFAGIFVCVAAGVLAVAAGLIDLRELFPNLPEPPQIDAGRFPLPDPHLPLPEIEVPPVLQPGEQVTLAGYVSRRPLVARIPAPQQVALSPQVLGTNLFLAIIMALLFGASSAVLGNMLRDEEPRIRAWLKVLGIDRLAEWVARAIRWGLGKASVKRGCLTLPFVILIFALYGIIFAFLEEGTSLFSREGAFLAVTMAFSAGLVSFGGDIARRIAGRIWHAKTSFNIYPINLLTAAFTVFLSRTLRLSPGIAFGTPGGADVDIPADKAERRESALSLITIAILFFLGGTGWLAAGATLPLLTIPFDSRIVPVLTSVLTAVQNTGLALFMVALETLFFETVPLAYSLGRPIFRRSKLVWAVIFVPIAFVFNHTLLNPQSGFLDSFLVSNVRFLWVVLLVLTAATAGLWFYFNIVDDVLKEMMGIRQNPESP
jgi:hypothetical protein